MNSLTDFPRDAVGTAGVLGFFAAAWFGWAQDKPPSRWRKGLAAGSILALLICLAGAIATWRRWNDGSAIDDGTGPLFGLLVGAEIALAGVGAWVLTVKGSADRIPTWVAFVVGIHMFPLALLLDYPFIALVGAMILVAGLSALPVARSHDIEISAVTGLYVGVVMATLAAVSLTAALS